MFNRDPWCKYFPLFVNVEPRDRRHGAWADATRTSMKLPQKLADTQKPGTCYRVDVLFIGAHKLTAY